MPGKRYYPSKINKVLKAIPGGLSEMASIADRDDIAVPPSITALQKKINFLGFVESSLCTIVKKTNENINASGNVTTIEGANKIFEAVLAIEKNR